MNFQLSKVAVLLGCLLLLGCGVPSGDNRIADVEPFYGRYSGTAVSKGKDDGTIRDLAVLIKPWEDRGFSVDWTTVIHRKDAARRTHHSINFYPSPRPGIFASAMKTDVFGHTVPFDPVIHQENPYVWATMANQTLTISALYIIDDGGYEIQVYRRSLKDNEMLVEFERISNGTKVAQVTANLTADFD